MTGHTPQKIKEHYGIDGMKYTGKGMRIGIIEAYISDSVIGDTEVFCSTLGIKKAKIKTFGITDKDGTNEKWKKECSLDVQWAHAFAPDAEIHLYGAGTSEMSKLIKTVYKASLSSDIVSVSFGMEENAIQREYEKTLSRVKCPVICASGDNGGVNYPASSYYALSVGGTYIDGSTEIPWDVSGQGISLYTKRPEWQKNTGYDMKTVPDISFFASGKNGAAFYCGKWQSVCGTSVSAPCIAGIAACICEKIKSVPENAETLLYEIKNYLYSEK